MKRPVIGITLCLDAHGRWRPGRRYVYLDEAYSQAIERAGGLPLQLPIQTDAETLAERIDGLLLPGGDDFPPQRSYPKNIRFDLAPPEQIAFDAKLLAAALARELPVLGICYGAQLLALHHGGRLHAHLPLDRPESQAHRLPESDGRHAIEVEPESRLASIVGNEPEPVNSLHHQAIAETGKDLRVSARSPDGVIEAVEASGARFALGVQWHPEKLGDKASEALFRTLVSEAAAKERSRGA